MVRLFLDCVLEGVFRPGIEIAEMLNLAMVALSSQYAHPPMVVDRLQDLATVGFPCCLIWSSWVELVAEAQAEVEAAVAETVKVEAVSIECKVNT